MYTKNKQGFTLIELMIVIVIVSVIMAFAIPNYRDYVLRSHRVEAQNALSQMASLQERYYANNNRYGDATELNLTTLFPAPTAANGRFYTISMASTPTSYTITADAAGTQTQDTDCLQFTLDNLGQRGSTSGLDCW